MNIISLIILVFCYFLFMWLFRLFFIFLIAKLIKELFNSAEKKIKESVSEFSKGGTKENV